MQFAREIKRVLFGLLVTFSLIGLAATYWAVVGPITIVTRDDNPRIIEDILSIQRGSIYDRDNRLLAETIRTNSETTRRYLHASTYSPLGYYSVRYGEAGVEAAFNDELNGIGAIDDLETYFEQEILNIVSIGTDIQLTLDVDIQDTLVRLMQDYRGAGVVMDAQTGQLLALASLPTFNPNTLDEDWDTLTVAEGNPFFNRALQGQYQPGGVMYTLWLSQALLSQYDLSSVIAEANSSVALGDETIVTCVRRPDQSELTLQEAYQYGCPVPFAVYRNTTAKSNYSTLINAFGLDNQISLADFPVPEPITSTSGTNVTIEPNLRALRDTLGQGNIRVTPLHIAGIMSAIANNGNAPIPQIQQAIRPPEVSDWQPVQPVRASIPMMTATTVRQVRTIMQSNWQSLQSETYQENIVVGATIATSLSGEETQLWLIGFVRTEQSGHVAFVVLLEDTMDVQRIIEMGQALIQNLIRELTVS